MIKTFSRYKIEIEFEGRKYIEYVTKENFVLGRSSECDLHLDSKNLSRQHLKVKLIGGEILIEDLNSTNGSFVDGEQIEAGKLVVYSSSKVLTLGKHDDVKLVIKAQYSKEKEAPAPKPSAIKDIKKNLLQIFKKDPLSLEDPPPKKAEQEYKEIMNQVEILKTEIVDRAEKRADKIVDDAKNEAKRIIAEAEEYKPTKEEVDLSEIIKQIESKTADLNKINEEIETSKNNLSTFAEKNKVYNELVEKIKNSEENKSKLQAEYESLEDNLKEAKETIEQAQLAKSSFDSEKAEHEKSLQELKVNFESEKQEQERNLEVIKAEYALKEDEIKKLSEEKDQLENSLSSFAEKRKELDELKLNISSSIAEFESKNNELQNVKEALEKTKETFNKFEKDKEEVNSEKVKIQLELEKLKSEVETKEVEIQNLNKDKVQVEEGLSALFEKQKEFEGLKTSLKSTQDELNLTQKNLNEAQAALSKVKDEINNLNKEKLSFVDSVANQKKQIDDTQDSLNRIQDEYEEFLEKQKTLLAEIDELNSKKENSVHELSKLKEQTVAIEKDSMSIVSRAREEADKIISDAMTRAQNNADEIIQKAKKTVADREEELLRTAKTQSATFIENAQREAKNITDEAKLKSDELVLRSEEKSDKLVKEAQTRADELRDKAQEDFKKLVKEAEQEAEKIKVSAIQNMDDKKKDFVELEKKKLKKSAEILKSELNVLLYSKLKLYLKSDSEESLARAKSSLEAAVNSSMLSEIMENEDEMYALLDDQVLKQQQKAKNYWRYTVPGVIASLFLVYFIGPVLKERFKDHTREVASVSKKESEKRIKQMEEETKQKLFEHFEPMKSTQFKDTYTDRVLYTDHYAELSLDKEYREDWILELQTFFTDKLELSENSLVPFISQEANMIKELVAQSKRINGKFIDEGIARMRETENEFLEKLKENVPSDKDYKKIIEFQKKFFNKRVKKYR